MKLAGLFKPFASFRAQMVAFIACTLLISSLVILLINQRLETRTTRQVDEYIQAITLATNVTFRSLSEGLFLYNLVNQSDGLRIDSESIIRHILIVEPDGKVYDSTDRQDRGRQFNTLAGDLPPVLRGDFTKDVSTTNGDQNRTLFLSTETEKGVRKIYIIISMSRLNRVKQAAARDRMIAFAGLGALLIALVAVFSRRFTQPITDLGQAARRVTAGQLDFEVPVKGPEEVGALAKTFNEMLTVLRRSRELEEQLQRSERSAVIGRLASGIAHEIRNPLNFINLSIDHLRETFGPANEAQRAQYKHILTTIKDELARLNRLVSDFLSYGRPAKLKLRELDALTLVEEVRDLVKAKADEQGVKITIASETNGDGTKLSADPEQLKTCFSNLMINAIQAMPAGGELEVGLFPETDRLEIEVTDTGTGILPEAMEQIFEPYYSTKETGIGLGLPLTKKIIEEHGGQIRVESEVGLGTTFVVTLPRKAASENGGIAN
ncbi:MAG TPA: ATP-binding protein [Blastocatellia bacterium]|nr:ATP-binding protein [Blastocatellia bacterium]